MHGRETKRGPLARARTSRPEGFAWDGNERSMPLPGSGCRVTIGMPVYNGERYLERAIVSILAQTYTDFRLLILDNASTDRTAEIAARHAANDPRIVYRRNQRNLGAGPNFNKVFALSDSQYFKWAAHDDELHPRYLEACVRSLESEPAAVLAHSLVEEIDEGGKVLRVYSPVSDQVAAGDRLTRFRSRVLVRGWCTEIFALMRADRLRGTALIASYAGADLSLIAELTLRGRFIIVPEPLFRNRLHQDRYTETIFENLALATRPRQIVNWYDTSNRGGRWHFHWWKFLFSLFAMINRNLGPWSERVQYYRVALQWMIKRDNRRDLAKDLLFALSPGVHQWLLRASRRTGTRGANRQTAGAAELIAHGTAEVAPGHERTRPQPAAVPTALAAKAETDLDMGAPDPAPARGARVRGLRTRGITRC
jgi:glycosyltransferase involved in cell wall biosynthesis